MHLNRLPPGPMWEKVDVILAKEFSLGATGVGPALEEDGLVAGPAELPG